MKRNKMSLEIEAKVHDEQGYPVGKVTIDENDGDELSASGDYGADVVALRQHLKAAYQRWLEASDEELDAGVSMALGVAMEGDSNG